jgi:hypothetical protein
MLVRTMDSSGANISYSGVRNTHRKSVASLQVLRTSSGEIVRASTRKDISSYDPLVFVYITNVAMISVLLSPHSHALRPRFHWWQNQIDFPFKACGRLKIRPPSKILSQFPRNCKWQHIVIGGGAPPLVKE